MLKLTAKQRNAIFQAMCQYQIYGLYRDGFRECVESKNEHRDATVRCLVDAGFTPEQVYDTTGLKIV